MDRHALDPLALDRDLAAVGPHQADDHVEAGRLAGAVRPEQADHLAAAAPPAGRRRRRCASRRTCAGRAPRAGAWSAAIGGVTCLVSERRRRAQRRRAAADAAALRRAAAASAAAGVPSRGISTARTRPAGIRGRRRGAARDVEDLGGAVVGDQVAGDLVGRRAAAQPPHRGVADEADDVRLAVVFQPLGVALDPFVGRVALLPEHRVLAGRADRPSPCSSRRAFRGTSIRAARIVIVPLVTTTLPLKTTYCLSRSILPGSSDSMFSGLTRSAFSACDASGRQRQGQGEGRQGGEARSARWARESCGDGASVCRMAAQNLQAILCAAGSPSERPISQELRCRPRPQPRASSRDRAPRQIAPCRTLAISASTTSSIRSFEPSASRGAARWPGCRWCSSGPGRPSPARRRSCRPPRAGAPAAPWSAPRTSCRAAMNLAGSTPFFCMKAAMSSGLRSRM